MSYLNVLEKICWAPSDAERVINGGCAAVEGLLTGALKAQEARAGAVWAVTKTHCASDSRDPRASRNAQDPQAAISGNCP